MYSFAKKTKQNQKKKQPPPPTMTTAATTNPHQNKNPNQATTIKRKFTRATVQVFHFQILPPKIHFIIIAINYLAFKTILLYKLPLKH